MPGIRGEKKTNVPLERGNKGKVSAYVYISNLPTVKNELGSKNNVIKVRIYFQILINKISYSMLVLRSAHVLALFIFQTILVSPIKFAPPPRTLTFYWLDFLRFSYNCSSWSYSALLRCFLSRFFSSNSFLVLSYLKHLWSYADFMLFSFVRFSRTTLMPSLPWTWTASLPTSGTGR